MISPCPDCGHRLWSEVRKAGAFRFLAHFDDDERSATYAEHTHHCPGCGVRLDAAVPAAPSPTGDP